MRKITKTILWVTVFAVAMAFLETSVVVYLRKLYYPGGFSFPLKIIDADIAVTEFFREIATLVMLAGIGIVAGRTKLEKFAFFIFSFAVWDIFYYVFLKILLCWPESLMTWDVLFLVPFTWVGPVLAPLLNSLTMILLTGIIVFFTEKNGRCITRRFDWLLLLLGSLVVIASYTEDYLAFMLQRYALTELFNTTTNKDVIAYAGTYIPDVFQWWIFLPGVTMHLAAIVLIWRRNKRYQAAVR